MRLAEGQNSSNVVGGGVGEWITTPTVWTITLIVLTLKVSYSFLLLKEQFTLSLLSQSSEYVFTHINIYSQYST